MSTDSARAEDDVTTDEGPTTWNHRVAVFNSPTGAGDYDDLHRIIEVYYRGDEIIAWSEDYHGPQGDSVEELRAELNQMLAACDLPVLAEDELPKVPTL